MTAPNENARIVAGVRRLSGISAKQGPDDTHIISAVRGFAEQVDYWYTRVMRAAVPRYRDLVVKRINPFIRRIECEGLSAKQTAAKLVDDYNSRNFVTAGGWALEALAVRISPNGQKSTAAGIDVQRIDTVSGDYHLYVLKSGLVTRNSDILSSLKRNARKAEQLLRQGNSKTRVHAHYAIVTGKTKSSFEDGINRPSSAETWSHMTELPEGQALKLALALAAEAGRLVRRDAASHIAAMKLLVSDYIAKRGAPKVVDWEFIARRNMEAPKTWKAVDKQRHQRALAELAQTGYVFEKKARKTPRPARTPKAPKSARRSRKR